MFPDRSVTYVPGLYPVPPNQRMDPVGARPSVGVGLAQPDGAP